MGIKKKIYCYETKEEFESIDKASKKYKISRSNIRKSRDLPNKTSGGFHWCSDLNIFDGLDLSSGRDWIKKKIYCYETKEEFNSISKACNNYNILNQSSISICLNNPNKIAVGFHWCTDLSIFDNIELTGGIGSQARKREVYCYETKQKFKSCVEASKFLGLKNSTPVFQCLNNPNRTTMGYHFCTSIDVFKDIDLNIGLKREVYCYETKQKFKSLIEATKSNGLRGASYLSQVVNNPNRTSAGYHWCTDLSIFDGIKLIYPLKDFISLKEIGIVEFLYDNNITNIITSDRNIIYPYELDVYLPDYNLAIEFNGNYWHSIEFKDRNYHQDKTLKCLDLGIDLIQIFEFQWDKNKELYKNYILDRINNVDRPDFELDSEGNHILQFCNKKYSLENKGILEPKIMNHKYFNIYDCGKIKLK